MSPDAAGGRARDDQPRARAAHRSVDGLERHIGAVAEQLEAVVGTLAAQHRDLVGVPTDKRGIVALLADGVVDEPELVWLAAAGVLSGPSTEAFVQALAPWKHDLIAGGLLVAPDPAAEARLSDAERLLLRELRRCRRRPVEQMRSIGPLARHGHLDPEKHHRLAERYAAARTGVEGIGYGVRAVGADTSALVAQGARQATVAQQGVAQRDVALALARAGLLEQRAGAQLGRRTLAELERIAERVEQGTDACQGLPEVLERAAAAQEEAARQGHEATALARRAQQDRAAIRAGTEAIGATVQRVGDAWDRRLSELGTDGRRSVELLARMDAGVGGVAEGLAELGRGGRRLAADGRRLSHAGAAAVAGIDALNETASRQLDALGSVQDGVAGVRRGVVGQSVQLAGVRAAMARAGDVLQGIGERQAEAQSWTRESVGRVEAALGRLERSVWSVGESLREIDGEQRWRELDSRRVLAAQHLRDAVILLERGRRDRALDSMDRAVRLAPADASMFFHRALCHIALDRPLAGRADLMEALALLPPERTRERAAVRLALARVAHAEALASARAGRGDASTRLADAVALAVEPAEDAAQCAPESTSFARAWGAAAGTDRLAAELADRGAAQIVAHPTLRGPGHAREALAAPFIARLALDAVALGDHALAVRCIAGAVRSRPVDVLRGRVLTLPALQGLRDDLEHAVVSEARSAALRSAREWYALAALCTACDTATEADAVRAFRRGAARDPDAIAQRAERVRATIRALAEEDAEPLLAILRRDRCPEWRWLAAL